MGGYDRHFEHLLVGMNRLRPLFEGRPNAAEYLSIFDDFLEHAEFGLALNALCDYLKEQAVPLEPSTLEQIASLYARMELKDDCIEALRHNIKGR